MATFKIVRLYQRDPEAREVLKTGLTLEEAQEHCNDPETSSQTATGKAEKALTAKHGAWFDSYYKE